MFFDTTPSLSEISFLYCMYFLMFFIRIKKENTELLELQDLLDLQIYGKN